MQLHDVHQGIHKRKKRKRVGRGPGSGHGKTSSKGHKGHSSRQGFKQNPLGEGGQMPIIRRVPKRGFNNGLFRTDYATLNVGALEALDAGAEVDEAVLRTYGLVKGRHEDGLKILGDGELTKALIVRAVKFTEQAARKIEAAGGQAVVVEAPRREPQAVEDRALVLSRAKPRGRRNKARLAEAKARVRAAKAEGGSTPTA